MYLYQSGLVYSGVGGGASAKVEMDVTGTGNSSHLDSSETVLEPTTNSSQSSAKASPVGQHRMLVHSSVAKDSFDLAGSDRETDKESSVGEDERSRRPLVNSIRRRVLQSTGSSGAEQPMNSSPGTPRR